MNFLTLLLLAQNTPSPQAKDTTSIFFALAWLVIGAAALIAAGIAIRKLLVGTSDGGNLGTFSLPDLRRMKAAGQITEEEFARAKAVLIAANLAAMNRGPVKKNADVGFSLASEVGNKEDETDDVDDDNASDNKAS